MKKTLVFLFLMLFAASADAFAQAVLSWDYPATNTDGSSLTDLGGFKVYYGTSSGNYSMVLDIGMASVLTDGCAVQNCGTYTVSNLTAGTTYYFAMTAYDVTGNESTYSNEVFKAATSTAPSILSSPTNIQISVDGGTITIGWDKPNASVSGYQIFLGKTSSGAYWSIYDVGAAYPSAVPCVTPYTGCERRQYILNRIAPGNYYFALKAYDTTGNISGLSAETAVTLLADSILPADVTNFTASAYGTGVRLTWTNPANPDFSETILSFSTTSNDGPWTLLTNFIGASPGSDQAYNHLDLPSGTYYYKIQTRDTSGNTTSTRHTYADVKYREDYSVAITDFTADPSEYFKTVHLSWIWPKNPYIKSAKVEYRILGYDKKVTLIELIYDSLYGSYYGMVSHDYTDRLIGEQVEYTLILIDVDGNIVDRANTTANIPTELKPFWCDGCGGGGIEIATDNAEKDFPIKDPAVEQKEKKNSGGSSFGCGTISSQDPPSNSGTDISITLLALILLFLLYTKQQRVKACVRR